MQRTVVQYSIYACIVIDYTYNTRVLWPLYRCSTQRCGDYTAVSIPVTRKSTTIEHLLLLVS